MSPCWRDARAVESGSLENCWACGSRGFESHSLRHFFESVRHVLSGLIARQGWKADQRRSGRVVASGAWRDSAQILP